ncbi:MAG: hypothetical protein GTN36_00180 [Candidatus Aenigmarchaeota archaeon]|nr:hypothetical protein [Candidatus Aenigmarchaeota archaeon]
MKWLIVIILLFVIIIAGCLQEPSTSGQQQGLKGALAEDCMLLLSGTIFKDDSAVADKPWHCFKDRKPSSMGNIPPGYGNYSIVLLDKDGNVLDEFKFSVSFFYMIESSGGYETVPTDRVPFMFEILAKKGTSEVLIKHFDKVLIRESMGGNVPTVNIIFPNGGEELERGKTYTIKWEGYDADDDELFYTLAYTTEEMRESELAIPLTFDNLKESEFSWFIHESYEPADDYQIKIIVSDGVNTNTDTSDETFTIK